MLTRYLDVYKEVDTTLDNLNMGQLKLSHEEMELVISVAGTLEPIEILVKEISKRSTNLIESEASLLFTLKHLKSLNTEVSLKMHKSLSEDFLLEYTSVNSTKFWQILKMQENIPKTVLQLLEKRLQ